MGHSDNNHQEEQCFSCSYDVTEDWTFLQNWWNDGFQTGQVDRQEATLKMLKEFPTISPNIWTIG